MTDADSLLEIGRLRAENKRLKEKVQGLHSYMPTCRYWLVDENDCCTECGGSGYQTYGSTATWRGGAGGASITIDVCDRCWGSGSKSAPWPSHRILAQPK